MATILVIDDHEPVRALLRAVLEKAGHEVTEAPNGRVGLEVYRARPADLVVTDICMPEMNGLDLILELTQAFLNVKVIAMSGADDLDTGLPRARLLGARQTIQKPFSMEVLVQTVQDNRISVYEFILVHTSRHAALCCTRWLNGQVRHIVRIWY